MIYFEPRLQQRVLTTFHYALRPGCHLFLGPTHEVPSYIEQLRSQPTEAELLFRELLIGVTRFFRAARRRCRSFDRRRRAPLAGQ